MSLSVTRRDFLRLSSLAAVGVGAAASARAAETPGLVVGQAEAARVGRDILAGGGNAVDAVVAAAFVAAVVSQRNCGIGGYGGHAVVATPAGMVTCVDFNGTAPQAARPDLFPLDDKGAVKGQTNVTGWLAAGVPGTVAGLGLVLEKHGTKPLAHVLEPAIRRVRDGFPLLKIDAEGLRTFAGRLKADAGSAKLFYPGGEPLADGAPFRNPDLARLLQTLADAGSVRPFYEGPIGERIAAAFKANGGLVTAADLASFRARVVEPLTLTWNGKTVVTAPLTAGGLTVLQALATLRALAWEKEDPRSAAATHARVEALRLAWRDRLTLLGDPDKVTVPVAKLLSPAYATAAAECVRRAVAERKAIPGASDGRGAGGTIHLSAVDGSGLAAALTLTHGEAFGARVTVDGLGLVLGHGMSRFDPRPGHPNCPDSGKRPLHNMCPTVVLEGGRPVAALGATGGRRIPNTLFDVLALYVGRGEPLAEAVRSPRVHTEGGLQLTLEKAWPDETRERLRQAGYTIATGGAASFNGVSRDPSTGTWSAAAR